MKDNLSTHRCDATYSCRSFRLSFANKYFSVENVLQKSGKLPNIKVKPSRGYGHQFTNILSTIALVAETQSFAFVPLNSTQSILCKT